MRRSQHNIRSTLGTISVWVILIGYLFISCSVNLFHGCANAGSESYHRGSHCGERSFVTSDLQHSSHGFFQFDDYQIRSAVGNSICLACFYLKKTTSSVTVVLFTLSLDNESFYNVSPVFGEPNSFSLSLLHNRAPPVCLL